MKKTSIIYWVMLAFTTLFVVESCKKKDEFVNPFGDYVTTPLYSEPVLASVPSSNFAYLQEKVFKPTCANSGCHDGAFEPDFRTISSSYNSTVYHSVLTNDASNTFTYRVQPGNSTLSLMHERLITALPNTSGIMPPTYADEWIVNKQSHINSIKNWIDNGALDMYGNTPQIGNPSPFVSGFQVFQDGSSSNTYTRAPGVGITPYVIPAGNVDLWFSITDDSTPATSMTVNEIKILDSMYNGFDAIPANVMTTTGTVTANDFENNSATFTHKYDFDASGYASGTILYVRIYVQDADHNTPLETPKEGSAKQILYLFSLYVN